MFGLLGGLLGGGIARRGLLSRPLANRPLGGLLAKRMMSNRGGSPSPGGGAPAQAPPPQEDQTPEASKPTESQEAPAPKQAPEPPPLVQQTSQKLDTVAEQTQENTQAPPKQIAEDPVEKKPQEKQEATAGLLDDAPPVQSQSPPLGSEEKPVPQQVVNQTDQGGPVAQAADETFPNTPPLALSGLVDKIEEIPDRRTFPMEDPNPTKPVDTKSQAMYGQSGPNFSYQTAGSWTSMTPNLSYRR